MNADKGNVGDDTMLVAYLTFFFEGWKRGYKLGWIYYKMVEGHGKDATDIFFEGARVLPLPLVPSIPTPHAGTPYYLVTVNRRFSDWLFDKDPSCQKFCDAVLKNRHQLLDTKDKWVAASRESNNDLSERKWDALDSFGGKVKELRRDQLLYDSRGRKTGKGMSERTWAKK